MQYDSKTPDEYLQDIPEDRREAVSRLRQVIQENLPPGFEEGMGYGMMGFQVPLKRYPQGYHTTPGEPLPFIGIAAQKNHIALYHMGIYALPELEKWFVEEYAQRMSTKLDMGKSCIRFKNPKTIPFDLIGELAQKITLEDYIRLYEEGLKQRSEMGKHPKK
jgi:uncharacterized protein YdhG (YjbR/CyaY superfamily)